MSTSSPLNENSDGVVERQRHGNSHHTPKLDAETKAVMNADAKLSNPLRGISHDRLMTDVEIVAQERGLTHLLPDLKKGALIAQDPSCVWQYRAQKFLTS
ncbi:hypothetical protein AZE42_13301 [Rhizopogon vesiculosus]|uniref:Uncharacterized protein n=1 Tax=Rhizopogon vesiculosus TaxID=180088 RepID=A0A1J8QP70_9AGAM|nr:hypothetical protein AZE42_13301 [Rhizopogon vesiculosus]